MSITRVSSLLAFTLVTALAACGSEGPQGEMGDPGTPGPKGDMGDPGQMGTPGTPGQAGTPGQNGQNGMNGSAGLSCWDLNANSTCDVGAEDKNNDTMCTALDCQGPQGPAGATAGQGAGSVYGNAALTVASSTTTAAIPGLAINVTVPASGTFVAFISSDGGAVIPSTVTDPDAVAVVSVFVRIDGNIPTSGGFQNLIMLNSGTAFDKWSFSMTQALAAGTHTITINAAGNGASTADATVSGPVGNGLQGSLNVLLLKL